MGLFHALVRRWEQTGASSGRRLALRGASDIVDLPAAGVTYAQLGQRARRAAGLLHSLGLRPGDVVAVQLPRSLALLELHLGALALGVTSLLLNDRATAGELAWTLDDAQAKVAVLLSADSLAALPAPQRPATILGFDGLRARLDAAPSLDDLPEPDDDALACLMYTSGTTGRPKGAMISHANLLATLTALHQVWQWGPRDHLLHALPLFHIHGLVVAQYGALWAGARTTWMGRFDAEGALAMLARQRCTVFMGVPTFYHRMLALQPATSTCPDPDLSGMRLFTSGSAALPASDHRDFQARYGHTIVERYGMTEVGIVLSNPVGSGQRAGTVGFPLPGVTARVMDPKTDLPCPRGTIGELQIQAGSVVRGYLRRPEQTAEALGGGYLKTGDLALVDDDGYFHIAGRIKELIISGGFNVYPLEIEAVLRRADGVAQAAVVGLPDDDLGERVVAAVVAQPGRLVEPQRVLAWLRQELALYKCPRALVLVDSLPRNAMGKVQKARLVKDWSACVSS